MLNVLKMSGTFPSQPVDERYATGKLVRRLCALAWQFRADCLWSQGLSVLMRLQ
jgi:hypothetical protein